MDSNQQQQQQSYCNNGEMIVSSTSTKSKAQLNSGNYINVVPMAVVNSGVSGVQYHHRSRKYPAAQLSADYQSRIYFDNYVRDRCREEINNSYYSIPQQQQSVATSTSDTEQNNSSLVIPNPTNNIQIHPTSLSSCSTTSGTSNHQQQTIAPSVLYTVQRVVSTSQLQQLTPNYGNNSNPSNLTNVISRNDTDCGPNKSTNNFLSTTVEQQESSNSGNLIGSNNYGSSAQSSTSSHYANTNNQSIQRQMQKVIPSVVYLMSRIAVHMEIEGTAQCPSQVMLAAALGCEELGISNKLLAQNVFGLWMTSSLLETQLKPHHRPFAVRVAWTNMLEKYSHGNELEKYSDEPMISLRRNCFYSRRDEEKIKDPRILELLYEEARHNVLLGRYIMEPAHSIMLGGIQARIELGPYNVHTHTVSYFRENQFRFLPAHIARSTSWSWLPYSRQTSAEVRLLEQFKRVPATATTRKLMRKYLEFCWALPFYGSAFFHGQVEQPVRGLMSLFQQKDIPVLIAINEKGLYVIDHVDSTLLLGLKYDEFSWDFGKPSANDDPECLPCLFLQFGAVENGINVTKLMQIFSRQAAMMDALITYFVDHNRRRKDGADPSENFIDDEPNPIQNNGIGVLSNKLSKLTLATFDDEGRCIGQMGSLSISY